MTTDHKALVGMLRAHDDPLFVDAAAAIEALAANQERQWCRNCGTVTRTDQCDCTKFDDGKKPKFENYADALLLMLQESESDLEASRRDTLEEAAAFVQDFIRRNKNADGGGNIVAAIRALSTKGEQTKEGNEK